MIGLYNIVSNEKISDEHEIYSMLIDAPQIAEAAGPGQFAHIKCGDLTLRRPISIASAESGKVRMCYDVRGEGTKWLSEQKSGGKIDIIGPLGKGFDVLDKSKKVLLVGGGIGIYPLYFVAKAYADFNKTDNVYIALGFRSKGFITLEKEFTEVSNKLYITTDDGSYGTKGFATDIISEILDNNKIDILMTCGPKMMMKIAANEAVKRNIRCQVSIEERMGCGVGACLSCACKIKNETNGEFAIKRVCTDGPVFDIIKGDEVDWTW